MAQSSSTNKPASQSKGESKGQPTSQQEPLFFAPVADLIGFRLLEKGDGRAVVAFQPSTRHSNPMGTLHGGVICDIADAAMGAAYATTLQDDETFTTLEIKINFLKPVWRAALRAEGWVVKAGRTIGLAECDVYDESGSLVARATSTNMTLRGDAARGR